MTTNMTTTETEAPKAPRPIKPNYAGQPEGRSAIEGYACPTCKAAKGARCLNAAGAPTAYIHPARFARWVKAGSKIAPTKAAAKKAPAKGRGVSKAAK